MIDFKKLREPFEKENVEWRIQSVGKTATGKMWAICMAYLNVRAVTDRLDDVCGPENWKNQFAPGPCGGIMCGISILSGTRWVTKWDGVDNANDKQDRGGQYIDSVKSSLTGAMKRAAVHWGIGRYLYGLELSFAKIGPSGRYKQPGKPGQYDSFRWDPPELPAWALLKKNDFEVRPLAVTPYDISDIRYSEGQKNNEKSKDAKAAVSAFGKYDITENVLENFLKKEASEWGDRELSILRTHMKIIMECHREDRAKKAAEIFM